VAQAHDGSLGLAHAFIDAIANAGADAVKFQTHIAREESTRREPWRVKFSPQDETRYEYWERMEFSPEQWRGLMQHAEERGLLFLSTPFSKAAVEMLADMGMKVWKVASGELGNLPLLEAMIGTGRPVILSSGMSDWQEIDAAVDMVRANGNSLAVLQCTSAYPCPPEKIGLNIMLDMRDRYAVPVGLSDHSAKVATGIAAAAHGAEVLEVHVTLSREMFGPDVVASLTTDELRQLVDGVRHVERVLAFPVRKSEASKDLQPLRDLFTKSVVASSDLAEGTILEPHHFTLKKPGTGLTADRIPELVGNRLCRDVPEDELILLEDVVQISAG